MAWLYKRLINSRYLPIREPCLLCGSSDGSGPLCVSCIRDMPWSIGGSSPKHFARPGSVSCWAPFSYSYPLDRLIPAAKLDGNLAAVRALALLFAAAAANADLKRPDFIVPVPLHWVRLVGRGFNQSGILAKAIGKEMGIEVLHDVACRTRHTRAQMTLGMVERKQNVIDVFRTKPLSGVERIAIVDDVVTTGSTAKSLACVLNNAGCGEVSLWALAQA